MLTAIEKQSPDIAQGVHEGRVEEDLGACYQVRRGRGGRERGREGGREGGMMGRRGGEGREGRRGREGWISYSQKKQVAYTEQTICGWNELL